MSRLSREEKRDKLRKKQAEREANEGKDFGDVFDLLDLSAYPELKKYKLKEGDNWVDVVPYEVTTDRHPDGIEEGEDDYKLEIWAHRNVGPNDLWMLCLKATFGKKCPICEYKEKLKAKGLDNKHEDVQAVNASKRCFYNVIDVTDNAETEDIQLFENPGAAKPTKWFEALVNSEAKAGSEETVAFYDLEEGKTIKVRGSLESFKKGEYIKPEKVDFEDRDPYEEDIYEEVLPLEALLKITTYAEVKAAFEGEDEAESDKSKDESGGRSRRSRSSGKEKEPEQKEEPKRSRRSKGKEQKEELEKGGSKRSNRRSKTKESPKEPELTSEEEEAIGGKCPHDYVFGVDFDSQDKDGCITCPDDVFNDCGDAKDVIKKADEKKEPAKSKGKGRRK